MGCRIGKYILSSRKTLQESMGIEIKLGRDSTSNQRVTAIVFDMVTLSEAAGIRELVKFEVSTLIRTSGHPNVVQLVDVLASPSKIVVIMESVSGGDLFEAIIAEGSLDESVARHYFGQILSAIEHCHSVGVCHRDIKPENVVLDKQGNVKLTGFALAGMFDPSIGDHAANLMHAICGTPAYVAPEVVQGLGYDGQAADVWSLGVTLYAMLAGFSPFQGSSFSAAFEKAQAGDFMFVPGMSEPACSLLERLLEPNPEKRYTLEQVRSHPWYTQGPGHRPPRAQAEAAGEHIGLRGSDRTDWGRDRGTDGRGYHHAYVGSVPGVVEVGGRRLTRRGVGTIDATRSSPSLLPSCDRFADGHDPAAGERDDPKRRSRERFLRMAVATLSASPDEEAVSMADSSISSIVSSETTPSGLSEGRNRSTEPSGSCGSSSKDLDLGSCRVPDGNVPDGKNLSSAESEEG